MSFPSAIVNLNSGMKPEQALLKAMETDTPDGFRYMRAFAQAVRERPADVLTFMRERVGDSADSILRSSRVNAGGLKVDVDPGSKLGQQLMRLLGTDAARSVLESRFEMSFALANCCAPVGGETEEEVYFSVEEQIAWQHSIDC